MKSKLRYLVMLFLMLFCLVACGETEKKDDSNEEPKDKEQEQDKDKEEDKPINISCNLTDEFEIEVGEQVDVICVLENNTDLNLTPTLTSSDESVLKFEGNTLKAYKPGTVTITIKAKDAEKVISCTVTEPTFEVNFKGEYTYSLGDETYKLDFEVSNADSLINSLGYEFTSSDTNVATIDENGNITTLAEGKVSITVTSKWNNDYKYIVEVTIEFDPLTVIAAFNIENPIYQEVTTYGSTELKQMVKGSVNYYSTMDLNLVENIIPITDNSPYAGQTATESLLAEAEGKNKYMRTGILHTETTKITYHDTGNNSQGANAQMHANYLVSSGNQSSRARSWHYTVDETKAIHHVPDNEVTWQGDNYLAYSTSIGIETCVDYGSELDITWHRTAKLMASLLVKYDMQVTDVVQHYEWSGKNCPQTLRRNDLYPYAIEMIKAEYAALTQLKDYTIEFTSLYPELVDDTGHIISIPETATEIAYVVTISNAKGYNKSTVLYSTIPGADGTKKDTHNNKALKSFYDLLANVDKDNYKDILAAYESMNPSDKERAKGLSYLLNKINEVLGGTAPRVSIEEVYVGTELRYQYFEIKNNGTMKVALNNYKIVYTDALGTKTTFGLPSKNLEKGLTYIIYCGLNEDVDPEESLLPDFAIEADISGGGTLEIYKGEDLVDKVVFTTNLTRIGYSGVMADDFMTLYRSPLNSKGEVYEVHQDVTNNVVDFEVAVLSVQLPLAKNEETTNKLAAATSKYNSLTSKEKAASRSNSYLKSLKTQYNALG